MRPEKVLGPKEVQIDEISATRFQAIFLITIICSVMGANPCARVIAEIPTMAEIWAFILGLNQAHILRKEGERNTLLLWLIK